jgi:hypothetical protein
MILLPPLLRPCDPTATTASRRAPRLGRFFSAPTLRTPRVLPRPYLLLLLPLLGQRRCFFSISPRRRPHASVPSSRTPRAVPLASASPSLLRCCPLWPWFTVVVSFAVVALRRRCRRRLVRYHRSRTPPCEPDIVFPSTSCAGAHCATSGGKRYYNERSSTVTSAGNCGSPAYRPPLKLSSCFTRDAGTSWGG